MNRESSVSDHFRCKVGDFSAFHSLQEVVDDITEATIARLHLQGKIQETGQLGVIDETPPVQQSQDKIAPGQCLFRIAARGIPCGGLEHPHQHGGFGVGEFRGGFMEIALCCRFHPENAVQPNGIAVSLQDFILGKPQFELYGDQQFHEFPENRLFGTQKIVFHQLLGYGGSPGPPAGKEITKRRFQKPDLVKSVVVIKLLIFHCQKGIAKVWGDLRQLHKMRVPQVGEDLVVAIQENRGIALLQLPQGMGQSRQGIPVMNYQQGPRDDHSRQSQQQQMVENPQQRFHSCHQ